MTTLTTPAAPQAAEAPKGGGWIEHWDPEDTQFWETTGKKVATRNLIFSIFSEHLGFSVWVLWSVSAALLAREGFNFTANQLFWLVAVPNLVGSLLRIPYTVAVPKFGGRNWTIISALLLVIPTGLFAYFVQQPGTSFTTFILISATAGFGGGNFASSMSNINHFYPIAKKGGALGLNAAGGNAGVAVMQFALPIIVGAGGAFGLFAASKTVHLEIGGYVYAGLAIVGALTAFLFMNNLHTAKTTFKEQLSIGKFRDTWVMSLIYIGTFGSFIGYSSAMPLLIKVNFFRQPFAAATPLGINFAYYAFLGALVGSLARPLGGMLADRFGGAKVTLASFGVMILGTLGMLLSLSKLIPAWTKFPPPTDPAYLKFIKAHVAVWNAHGPIDLPAGTVTPTGVVGPAGKHVAHWGYPQGLVDAVHHNSQIFPWFLAAFMVIFAATGIANGSAYRMIPAIWKANGRKVSESSTALGFIGAIGALGGFLIPITFNAPWVSDPLAASKSAFWIFTAFYVVCAFVTWAFYLNKRSKMAAYGV